MSIDNIKLILKDICIKYLILQKKNHKSTPIPRYTLLHFEHIYVCLSVWLYYVEIIVADGNYIRVICAFIMIFIYHS